MVSREDQDKIFFGLIEYLRILLGFVGKGLVILIRFIREVWNDIRKDM
jgi:hypothetical protein